MPVLLTELARLNDVIAEKGVTAASRAFTNAAQVGGPRQQKAALVEVLPDALAPLALAMSEGTCLIYDEQPGGTDEFEAQPLDEEAQALDPERLEILFDWALTQADAMSAFVGGIERWLRNVSRDTMVDNAAREGGRWYRHASATACGFCRMLATRGAVYATAQTAGEGNRYHDHCSCVAMVVRPGAPYVPAPYVEQWERDYMQARRDGHTDAASIARAMEKLTAARQAAASAIKKIAPKKKTPAPAPAAAPKTPAPAAPKTPTPAAPAPAPKKVADLKRLVIPDFPGGAVSKTNPRFANTPVYDPPEYRVNCQRCVMAYELRRRGFDVEAQPNRYAENDEGFSAVSQDYGKYWKNADGSPGEFVYVVNPTDPGLDVDATMVAAEVGKWGPGARGWVRTAWKPQPGSRTGGAHVFAVEVDQRGLVQFVDPQTSATDAADYFPEAIPGSTMIMRTDNLTPTDDVRRFVFDAEEDRNT